MEHSNYEKNSLGKKKKKKNGGREKSQNDNAVFE